MIKHVQLTESITSGFERMTCCVTRVISLDFCSTSFKNIHLKKKRTITVKL